MGRYFEHRVNACIVPPVIGLAISLKTVKKFHLGSRQYAEAHEHHPAVTHAGITRFGCQAQLSSRSCYSLSFQSLVITDENILQSIPQTHELAFHHVAISLCFFRLLRTEKSPQRGIGTRVKEGGEKAVSKDFPYLLLHFRREIIAAQVMQVLQVLINLVNIGQRTVYIVEVTDNELCPINKLVKLLRLVSHHLAISIIEGKHHLDIGRCHRACQLGHEVVD